MLVNAKQLGQILSADGTPVCYRAIINMENNGLLPKSRKIGRARSWSISELSDFTGLPKEDIIAKKEEIMSIEAQHQEMVN